MELSSPSRQERLTSEQRKLVKRLASTFEQTGSIHEGYLNALMELRTQKGIERSLQDALKQANLPPMLGSTAQSNVEDLLQNIRAFNIRNKRLEFRGQTKLHTSFVFHAPPSQPNPDLRRVAEKLIEKGIFEHLPQLSVPISSIIPTQSFLGADNMERVYGSPKKTGAFLLKVGDKAYVLDGHHRISARIADGDETVIAHVFKVT